MTIPKKMLPLRLALFKKMLLAKNMLTPATASSTVSAFTDTPSVSPKPWGPSFSIPSKAGTSTVIDLPVSTPEVLPTPKDQATDVELKMQSNNIVLAPQTVDSPVTKPNKPAGGVPLAQPVDAKALEQQRKQKGLKPGNRSHQLSATAYALCWPSIADAGCCRLQGSGTPTQAY